MTTHQRLTSEAAEVYVRALGDNVAQWDVSVWDGPDVWTAPGWATVTCQVRGMTWVDGADRVEGVMSSAAGGSWTLELYDPDREMDPTNPYGYLGRWVQPGQYIKVGFTGGDIGIGIIDELHYEPRTTIARLRGTDPVGLMATVEVDRPPVGVNTLRALARWVLIEMGAEHLTVEDDPPAGDEPIGAPDDAEATPSDKFRAWELIATAAQDVLNFAWIDRELVVRFRAHADATDPSIDLGCYGIPLLGVGVGSTGANIVNDVAAKDLAGGGTVTAEDAASKRRYGTRSIDRTMRKVPDAQAWADAVVEDRAWSSLEWLPLQAWPTQLDGLAQLEGIWGADMVRRVRIRADLTDPDIYADGRLIGRRAEVGPDGWNVSVLAYINNEEWATTPLPPPSLPDPLPAWESAVAVVDVDKVTRLSFDGVTAAGHPDEDASLVGTLGDTSARNRLVMGWTLDPTWTDFVQLDRAVLRLVTPPGVGDEWDAATWDAASWAGPLPAPTRPTIRVRALRQPFIEGAVIWPGPPSTAFDERLLPMPQGGSVPVELDVTTVVNQWVPVIAGGNGQDPDGFAIWSEDDTDPLVAAALATDDATDPTTRPTLTLYYKRAI